MCQFASGFFRPSTMTVKLADLNSHSETQRILGLTDGDTPNGWREFHYTPKGQIECRALAIDIRGQAECEARLRRRWPTFIKFLNWAVQQESYVGGSLYLGGLTSATGLHLPKSIGGSLYLNGLTSAAGLRLPESIGGSLHLGGLTSATGLHLPKSIGGSLFLGGLKSAAGLRLLESIGGSLYVSAAIRAELDKKKSCL